MLTTYELIQLFVFVSALLPWHDRWLTRDVLISWKSLLEFNATNGVRKQYASKSKYWPSHHRNAIFGRSHSLFSRVFQPSFFKSGGADLLCGHLGNEGHLASFASALHHLLLGDAWVDGQKNLGRLLITGTNLVQPSSQTDSSLSFDEVPKRLYPIRQPRLSYKWNESTYFVRRPASSRLDGCLRRTFAIVRITPKAALDFTTAPWALVAWKSFGNIWKMMIKSLRCRIGSFPTRRGARAGGGEGMKFAEMHDSNKHITNVHQIGVQHKTVKRWINAWIPIKMYPRQ